MRDTRRHDRTLRLLEGRLDALASASERSSASDRDFEVHVLGVVAATRHAVELELISVAEAGAVWAEVARRHPRTAWCGHEFQIAA